MRGLILVLASLLAGCTQSANSPETTDRSIVIANAIYFGFCQGYCYSELTIEGETLRLTDTSRNPTQFPPRTRTLTLSSGDRVRIDSLLDPTALSALEGVHGCPDCADGGGEWIEIRSGTDSTRVTFEYAATLTPIAPLQAELRALRKRFE